MKTFENYTGGKAAAVAEAKLHREQDHLASGFYYKNGSAEWKGCSVGCFVKTENNPHQAFAELFGVPIWFSRLVDHVFEALPEDERLDWHTQWVEALPESVDIDWIGPAHAARCLRRCVGYIGEGNEDWRIKCRLVVSDSTDILGGGRWLTDPGAAEAAEAARAAEAAGAAEAAEAAEAARAAEAAEAAWAARAAGAAGAAEAAEAAWAARAAGAAGAAWAAWAAGAAGAAEAAEIHAQRDDLLELLGST